MKRPIAPTTPIIKENFAVIRNELHDGHVRPYQKHRRCGTGPERAKEPVVPIRTAAAAAAGLNPALKSRGNHCRTYDSADPAADGMAILMPNVSNDVIGIIKRPTFLIGRVR